MRRKISVVFLLAFIMLGACFGKVGVHMVQAEDGTLTLTDKGDYSVAKYTDLEAVKTYINEKTYPTQEDYVFAGWFTSDDCTVDTAIRNASQVSSPCYAKFVDVDVLSVKCQISEGTAAGEATNIRFVSSVDSLVYKNIGFKLKGDTWTSEKTNKSKTVFERIASATEGDEYKFSPKVVDTESEYFITATWKGITDFAEGFYVRAYWITLDGTTVYGESRYVTVNDGLNENLINIPVKTSELPTGTLSVTYGDSNTSASVTASTVEGDAYTHLKIDLGTGVSRKNLSSATDFTITDGTTTVDEVYRNLYTPFTGSADETWYRKYSGEDEFVIATAGDLYGLATLVNAGTLTGKTVYMVSDIEVNSGDASAWTSTTTGVYPWTAIGGNGAGAESKAFSGIFDGQGHTISGIYMTAGYSMSGLFGVTTADSEIRDFILQDSYFYSTEPYLGSVCGFAKGNISEICSTVTVETAGMYCGGLVGLYGSASINKSISNCEFAGNVTSSTRFCGGLVGNVNMGSKTISNCLNSGKVSSSYADGGVQLGGLLGAVQDGNATTATTLVVEKCLNVGQVSSNYTAGVSSVIGTVASTNVTLSSVYTTHDINYTGTATWPAAADTGLGTGSNALSSSPTVCTDAEIAGFETFEQADSLGFYSTYEISETRNPNGYWVARANGTPVLRSFATTDVIYTPDTTWETDDTGVYVLNTTEELYGFSMLSQGSATITGGSGFKTKTIKLGADITINDGNAKDWKKETPMYAWITIANDAQMFLGTFDGQGHTISGVYLNTERTKSGLFANSYTKLTDFSLKNSYFNSSATALGSIVGYSEGNIDTVYSDAIVNSSAMYCGGLVGQYSGTSTASINNCWFAGSVTGGAQCHGGIVGEITKGTKTISNCLNSGSITNTFTTSWAAVGGLCGRGLDTATITITNCLNTGAVNASVTNGVNSLVGRLFGTANKVTKSYTTVTSYYTDSAGTLTATAGDDGGIGLGDFSAGTSEAVLLSNSEITGFRTFDQDKADKLGFYSTSEETTNHNNTNYWIARANGTPVLKSFATADLIYTPDTTFATDSDGYNIISTAEELYGLAKLSQASGLATAVYKLNGDITLNTGEAKNWADEAPMYSWITIGNETYAFRGSFDGDGHTVKGIYLDTDRSCSGMFAQTHNSHAGVIQNFQLKNSYFNFAGTDSGSVVGYARGNIDTVYSDAIVNSVAENCGGMIGRYGDSTTGTIHNSWFDGIVTSSNRFCGGIVGKVTDSGAKTIDNCLNTGKITATYTTAGVNAGGFVGACESTAKLYVCNSLAAGQLNVGNAISGSVIGNATSATGRFEHTYYLKNGINFNGNTISKGVGAGKLSEGTVLEKTNLNGVNGYLNTELDFYVTDVDTEGLWVARANDVPALKSFIDEGEWNKGLDLSTQRVFTEWYYYNLNSDETLYTISCGEDLYGLAKIVNDQVNNFAGKTVEINKDVEEIKLNKNANMVPIGRIHAFAGTFEGNNKTISGLYMKNAWMYMGLFGQTAEGSIIQNFSLVDSYVESTYASDDQTEVGGIVGQCLGSVENVYSNATVVNAGHETGGIVGRVNGTDTTKHIIRNCWFDGTITAAGQRVGGVVGNVVQGTTTIDNCLYTGTINSTWVDTDTTELEGVRVGGICGYVASNSTIVNINQSLSAGKITEKAEGVCVGSVFGRVTQNTTITLTDVYATKDGYGITVGSADSTITGTVTQTYESDRLIGYVDYLDYKEDNTLTKKGLDYDTYWVLRKEGVPALKSFVSSEDIYTYQDGDLGTYDGKSISLKDAVDYGVGNYMITIPSTDFEAYDNYISSLTDYDTISNADSSMDDDGVYNTVCTSKTNDWVINVTFVVNESTTYITVNTGQSQSPHLTSAVNYSGDGFTREKDGTTTVAMLSANRDEAMNSFVIQLPNGHFIINDGGTVGDLGTLLDYLYDKTGGKKPIIEAWTLTHFHMDHAQVLKGFLNDRDLLDKVYVEGFYFNEPSNVAKDTEPTNDDGRANLYNTCEQVAEVANLLKTTTDARPGVYRYQTGQRYYFNGMTMDVILAQEQISVSSYTTIDCFNTSSTTLLFTDTVSGKKVLIGGDATTINMSYIMEAYGAASSTLKNISVFQALHHGKNTTQDYANYLVGLMDNGKKFDAVLYPHYTIYKEDLITDGLMGYFGDADEGNTVLEENATNCYTYGDSSSEYKNVIIELTQ